MALEQNRSYRLVPRGAPGLACDAEGIALAGVALAVVSLDAEDRRRRQVCSAGQLGQILRLAYGAQPEEVVERCRRGLDRAAYWLESGDVARAGIEALMLRFPAVDAEGVAKLARSADLEKGGTSWQNEPRIPAGQPGGGQWTTGGDVGPSPKPARSSRDAGGRVGDGTAEVTVASPVRQSRTENANGFFPNSAGGGVLYIPSITNGQAIRPTEVHTLDANAFQVGWTNGAITLSDRFGHLYAVSPDDLAHFNATTGRMLGVSIYAHPNEPLGAPDQPPTAAEARQLDQERAAFEAGRLASEQSWSGRATTVGALIATALPLLAADSFVFTAGPVPELVLNAAAENETPAAIAIAQRWGIAAERAVGLSGPKAAIKIFGRTRVPDLLDMAAKVLSEVKNVAYQRLTPQLRDFLAYCRANGFEFRLYVRTGTRFSKELQELIDRGEIKLMRIRWSRIRWSRIRGSI
jgi:hypothetical protein